MYSCPDSEDESPVRCWWCGLKRGPESEEIWWGCGKEGMGKEGEGGEEAFGRWEKWVIL